MPSRHTPSAGGLSRSASDPAGLPALSPSGKVPVKRMDIRGRAAEIIALSYLVAPSSTGSLQHEQLRRVRHALEDVDEREVLASTSTFEGMDRDRQWTRDQLKQSKAKHRARGALPEEPRWNLRRGKWVYEGGPKDEFEDLSADEALRRFREEEERRGRGTQYRNGVGAPGLMRRFHQRNPSGGFFGDD
uniref:Uncharacterized protein n=1 Tax=Alexandrium monilatum TaxID=311494 RepID=A0A7S4WBZ2_9DINO